MTKELNNEWKFYSVIMGIDKFFIQGLNIWDNNWVYTNEYVVVQDPAYENKYKTKVINIQKDNNKIEFVAVEFSNEVWGIYLRKDYSIIHIKS